MPLNKETKQDKNHEAAYRICRYLSSYPCKYWTGSSKLNIVKEEPLLSKKLCHRTLLVTALIVKVFCQLILDCGKKQSRDGRRAAFPGPSLESALGHGSRCTWSLGDHRPKKIPFYFGEAWLTLPVALGYSRKLENTLLMLSFFLKTKWVYSNLTHAV